LVGALGSRTQLTSLALESGPGRRAAAAAVWRAIEGATESRSMAELEQQLQEALVPASRVATAEEIVRDEHLSGRRFFRSVVHPLLGQRRLIGLPWRFVGEAPFDLTPSPTLGSAGSLIPGDLGERS
jgi:crotonobetainyl-CoA:carnitine CoA-transferase CaiB-like acyl-CoA transferase